MLILKIILLVPFLMVMFLPLALKTLSPEELNRMGVLLEGAETTLCGESNHSLPMMRVACGNA